MSTHRFRARYRGIAWTAIGVGGTLAAIALGLGAATLPLVSGALGVAFGGAYLGSPTWRLRVIVDDEALEVRGPRGAKFRVPWGDVVRVVAAPTQASCFVDGGTPARSLLVPGEGAPAPYDIEDRPGLVAAILAHVPADRVQIVASLEAALAPPPA